MSLDRFDYWLDTFRYHRGLHRIRCALGRFQAAMKQAAAARDPAARQALSARLALPAYKDLLAEFGRTYEHLLATVSTHGGLATVVNLEGHAHFRPLAVDAPAAALAKALGAPLPADARPTAAYRGRPRIIVPTVRTSIAPGETLVVKAIVLAARRPREAALYWREMGKGEYRRVDLTHVGRGVHTVSFPPRGARSDVEYYLEATAGDQKVRFPATAPALNQTVVLLPAAD